jgi:DinB family protein
MINRPEADEYTGYFGRYIDQVDDVDPLALQREQLDRAGAVLATIPEARAGYRYAPDKWSIRQMVGHIADTERIMTCRAMRIARGDTTPLPGFDQDEFVAGAGFDARPMASLAEEWRTVRAAAISFFDSVTAETALRRGTASGGPMSVRALAYIIPGHFIHHSRMLRSKYGVEI